MPGCLKVWHAPSRTPSPHVSRRLTARHVANMSIPGIPGLGQDEPDEDTSHGQVGQTKVVDLKKEQEWRFEVALNRSIEVKVQCTCFCSHDIQLIQDFAAHNRYSRTLRHRTRPEQTLHLRWHKSSNLYLDRMYTRDHLRARRSSQRIHRRGTHDE